MEHRPTLALVVSERIAVNRSSVRLLFLSIVISFCWIPDAVAQGVAAQAPTTHKTGANLSLADRWSQVKDTDESALDALPVMEAIVFGVL